MNRLTQGALAEFFGTFLFVLISAGAVVSSPVNTQGVLMVALASGLALGVAVTCFMYISGGQFNPAVSIGLVVARKQSPLFAAVFIAAQLLGAVAAAGVLLALLSDQVANTHNVNLGATIGSLTVAAQDAGGLPLGLLGIEMFCTFFLMTAVLAGTYDGRAQRLGGFTIGLTVAACGLFAGPLTGASMNPARTFGPALCGNHWDVHWAYWVAPILGSCLAALAYRSFWQRPPTDPAGIGRDPDSGGDVVA